MKSCKRKLTRKRAAFRQGPVQQVKTQIRRRTLLTIYTTKRTSKPQKLGNDKNLLPLVGLN